MLASTETYDVVRLLPCRVQKASVLPTGALCLEVYTQAKEKRWLVVAEGHLEVHEARPSRDLDGMPPAVQGLVRKELVPSILTTIEERAFCVELSFSRGDAFLALLLEATADPRCVVVQSTEEGRRVLATIGGAARPVDGRDVRRGRLYEPPRDPRPPIPRATKSTQTTSSPATANARAQLRAEAKRLRRLIDGLSRDLERHGDSAHHEESGELLKTVLSSLTRGQATVDVTDWTGAPRMLTLDPALDARRNLDAFFRRAKRAREATARVAPRLTDARERLAEIERVRALADAAETFVESAAAFFRATPSGPSARRRAARSGPRKPWRSFRASRDVVIRVGRGARDNDALVKDARGHDLWLHARDQEGAHVVVPVRTDDVDPEVFLDAAHLALHFSSARGERRGDVQSTRVKHLRKPGAGAPAGFVHVGSESVTHVRMEPERIARLLDNEVPA